MTRLLVHVGVFAATIAGCALGGFDRVDAFLAGASVVANGLGAIWAIGDIMKGRAS